MDAEKRANEYLQLAQRLQADFENFRKRTLRENEDFKKFAAADLISDMISIVDDFDRAIASAKEDTEFLSGMKGIRMNMMKILESKGLKEIPAEGKFDPNFHEAFCVVEGDEDGNIAEVLQKGYTLGDKVLRFTKVKVTKKKEQETEVSEEEEKEQ